MVAHLVGTQRLEDIKVGEVVWAKMQSFPWWPAQVLNPEDASDAIRRCDANMFAELLVLGCDLD